MTLMTAGKPSRTSSAGAAPPAGATIRRWTIARLYWRSASARPLAPTSLPSAAPRSFTNTCSPTLLPPIRLPAVGPRRSDTVSTSSSRSPRCATSDSPPPPTTLCPPDPRARPDALAPRASHSRSADLAPSRPIRTVTRSAPRRAPGGPACSRRPPSRASLHSPRAAGAGPRRPPAGSDAAGCPRGVRRPARWGRRRLCSARAVAPVALDRVLDARHAAIAPRPGGDEARLLEHADRRGVVVEAVRVDPAEAEDVEGVGDEGASALGRVAEAPGVTPQAIPELGLVLAVGRGLELEDTDE